MNPQLRKACESIRELLASMGRSEVRTRHEIGAIIADVKRSRHKYGARAVAQISRALGADEQTLYRCAVVAECWTAPQMEALLARATELGQPLSFSHFVLLASVSSPRTRAVLFDSAVREALSVRRLAVLVEAPDSSATPGPRRDSGQAIGRLLRTTERLAREVESIDVVSSDPSSGPELREAARSALEQAIAATERLRALLDERLGRLLVSAPPPSGRPIPRRLIGL
jgi:hypothetical protein